MSSNISKFLESFKEILFKEELFKEDICLVLKEKINISIERKNIILRNNILSIQADPYIKTEIFLRKEEILKEIQGKHPQRNVLDVF
jgi:hypothetical protein